MPDKLIITYDNNCLCQIDERWESILPVRYRVKTHMKGLVSDVVGRTLPGRANILHWSAPHCTCTTLLYSNALQCYTTLYCSGKLCSTVWLPALYCVCMATLQCTAPLHFTLLHWCTALYFKQCTAPALTSLSSRSVYLMSLPWVVRSQQWESEEGAGSQLPAHTVGGQAGNWTKLGLQLDGGLGSRGEIYWYWFIQKSTGAVNFITTNIVDRCIQK